MNPLTKFTLSLSLAVLGITTARSAEPFTTLYDLGDTVLNGGTGENTFVSSTSLGAALSYNSGVPSLTQTLPTFANLACSMINFSPATLTNVGDSISVSYAFTPSSSSAFRNQDNTLRLGLFNSGSTTITNNLTGSTDSAFTGDTGYIALYRPTAGTNAASNTFYQRNGTGGVQNNIWDSSSRTMLVGPTLSQPGTGSVKGSFTLTRVATGVQMTSAINSGAAQSFIDTTAPFTAFDSFSFAGVSGATNPTLNFTDLTVTYHTAAWRPSQDLGERVWLDWWAEDRPNGPVTQWTSRNGSVVASGTATKQNGEVLLLTNQRLTFPVQSQANLAHRAVAILFRIDLTGSGDGSIFAVNGVEGGAHRQPLVSYNRNTNTVSVGWRTPSGYNQLSFLVSENASQWHCLVSRRVGTFHYASLDGKQVDGVTPGESQVAMADWAVPRENTSPIGYIGDFRTTGPQMAIDSVLVLQDELALEDAEKLMGWAMWRRGVQSQLPAAHPYRNQAPLSTPPTYTFAESTPTEYANLAAFWDNLSLSEQYKGTPINLSGWALDYEDQFNSHTVTNDVTGEGPWFGPTHYAASGTATAVAPTDANPQGIPATYIQSGSEMTIRMQNSGGWKTGVIASVNSNGYGRAWMYPYIEVRMKIGPSSTGNLHGAYPAVWVKSINSFYSLTESYLEYDIYEGYISDNKGFHNSYHNWPALRKLPSRLQTHRYKSNYLGLVTPGWHQNVNLFDGQYHTYGLMVTPDWVINVFDGRETFRFPTPVEMKQQLWLMVNLAMNPKDYVGVAGIYDLTIDYVRVYQNPAYAD